MVLRQGELAQADQSLPRKKVGEPREQRERQALDRLERPELASASRSLKKIR